MVAAAIVFDVKLNHVFVPNSFKAYLGKSHLTFTNLKET